MRATRRACWLVVEKEEDKDRDLRPLLFLSLSEVVVRRRGVVWAMKRG